MKHFLTFVIALIPFVLPFVLNGQYCNPFEIEEVDFHSETRIVRVDADWYPGWIEYNKGKALYPEPLEPLPKWDHPFMKDNLPSAMHEDSFASDISNAQGPIPENASVQYFQVKEKGKDIRVETSCYTRVHSEAPSTS